MPSAASETIHTASRPDGGFGGHPRPLRKQGHRDPERKHHARRVEAGFHAGQGHEHEHAADPRQRDQEPSRVAVESASSPCIAAQVPQDRDGVRRDLLQHPRHAPE